MELLQLKYFQAVAKNGNITKTAEQLLISPPSLSGTISRLEKELGVPLFERVGRRIQLNASGHQFLEHINRMFDELEHAVSEAKDGGMQGKAAVRVAVTTPLAWHDLFATFSAANPNIHISSDLLQLDRISKDILVSGYDFLITSPADISDQGLESTVLFASDYPAVMMHRDHPMAKSRQLKLTDLKGEPFIALTRGYSSRKYFDDICGMAGFSPNIVIECDYAMRAYMVKKKIGIAVSTSMSQTFLRDNSIRFVDIVEPIYPRAQAIFWSPKRYQTKAAQLFYAFAQETAPSMVKAP